MRVISEQKKSLYLKAYVGSVYKDGVWRKMPEGQDPLRSVFNKFGGNLGTMGSLAFLFDHKCIFTFKKKEDLDMEELILDLIDYNVEDEYDEDEEEGTITIYGDPKSYAAIQKHLEECGFEDVGGDFTYIPNDLKEVTPEQRETLDKMVERLEEFDDVQTVYTNMQPEGRSEEHTSELQSR